MKLFIVTLISLVAMASAAQLVLFAHQKGRGANHVVRRPWPGDKFHDNKASSYHVRSGTWECYLHPQYRGEKLRLIQGRITDLPRGWNDAISSCRPA